MEVLYDRLSRRAFGLAYRIVGDGPAAEDVVQEAFLSLWRSAERIDTARGKLQSYVLTIVHRRAIDALRSRNGLAERQLPEYAENIGSGTDFTERVVSDVDGEVVREALNELPEDQRQVVDMAYYQGLTHVEIAEKLTLPLGTVKSRMRLALDKMRGTLGAGGGP
ncbi:MAG: sigma-70 family RNA polymerase sigma factor [Dehalococcoidia bacterium]